MKIDLNFNTVPASTKQQVFVVSKGCIETWRVDKLNYSPTSEYRVTEFGEFICEFKYTE